MLRLMIAVALCGAVLSGVSPAQADKASRKQVSVAQVRAASDLLYSAILLRACSTGWRYTPEQVESGFRKHFAELTVRLIDEGYIITPAELSAQRADDPDALRTAVKRCTAL